MIAKFFHDLYEHPTLKPYRLNPCDCGAFPVLQPLGRALSAFGSDCRCCAGTRVLAAATLGALWPIPTLVAFAAILVALTAWEAYRG